MNVSLTANYDAKLMERAANIRLILMDVDGVLTDGKLYYLPGPDGAMVEFKGFNSHDGLGLHLCHFADIPTGVISGRTSPATTERARMLHMKYVYQGLLDKIGTWNEILADAGRQPNEVAYIGDDLPDVPLLIRAGLAIAVNNARQEVKSASHFITPSDGGHGAVRDAIELILKSKGLWEEATGRYLAAEKKATVPD